MSRARVALIWAGAAAFAALITWGSGAQPGYDTSWHLVWAHQILGGHSPSFNAWAAPTEHPLLVGISLAAVLTGGSSAGPLMVFLTLLALFGLMLAMRHLTLEIFHSGASGIMGWAILAGAYSLLLQALRGYLDVWFLMLVTIAAARIAQTRKPVAGWAALLAAGLLRPEGWILAGLATVRGWRGAERRDRAKLAASVAVPPAVWFTVDGLISGSPLLSFETAKNLEVTGSGGPLHVFAVMMAGGLRGPATLLSLIGLALAWRKFGPRRLMLALVPVATGLGMAVAITILGLTLLPRYLLLSALGLSLFGGYALMGWTGEAARPAMWRRLGIGATAFAVIAALGLGAPQTLVDEVRFDATAHRELKRLLADPGVRTAMNCGPLTFPSFRLIPDAKLILDDPQAIIRGRAEQPVPDTGVAITFDPQGDSRAIDRFGHPGIDLPYDESIPAGFKSVVGPAVEGDSYMLAWARCPGQKLSR